MNIITISRQFGSGGRELGKRLSEYLGYDYYDKEIIVAIAEKLKLDEKYIENMSEKLLVQDFNFHFGYSIGNNFAGENNSIEILKTQTDIIHNIANKGENFIIIGRAADALLKQYNPFNIFVYADKHSKISRCLDRDPSKTEKDAKELERQINKIDKQREKYCSMRGDGRWGDKDRYNLCVNTSKVHIKDIVASVGEYAKSFFKTTNTPFETSYNFD